MNCAHLLTVSVLLKKQTIKMMTATTAGMAVTAGIMIYNLDKTEKLAYKKIVRTCFRPAIRG